MSQPFNKKKGFVAPFQATLPAHESAISALSKTDSAAEQHDRPASDLGAGAATNPAQKPKKKKTRRPVTAAAESGRAPAIGAKPTAARTSPDRQTPSESATEAMESAAGVRPSTVPKSAEKPRPPAAEVTVVPGGGPAAPETSPEPEDRAAAPAAEPALPVGSALTASAAADCTPPDAPTTALRSPPSVVKRPNPAPALAADPDAPPPPVKRRLYKKTAAGQPGAARSGPADAAPAAAARRPPLDQKARLLALHARRTCGTWVQCCHLDCGKWRYLAGVQDPCQLPRVWHCTMNDDATYGWCAAPQEHIPNSSFPRLVAVQYTVGSLVWARLPGFPWWPAVVDDEPDTEDFFWLDGFSEVPTHYHVTFLDTKPVSRAWVTPSNVKKFEDRDDVATHGKTRCRGVEYRGRLEAAVRQAREALSCSLAERRRRFTFVARYPGPWPVYSDSDAETPSRLTDGRRPAAARRRRRDRRHRRPAGSAATQRRSRSRSRSPAGRRRQRSSSTSGSEGETVNTLMDEVDDIVRQLTQSQSHSQSQSQSQSQARHSQSQGGAGDAGGMFTDSSSSDAEDRRYDAAIDSAIEWALTESPPPQPSRVETQPEPGQRRVETQPEPGQRRVETGQPRLPAGTGDKEGPKKTKKAAVRMSDAKALGSVSKPKASKSKSASAASDQTKSNTPKKSQKKSQKEGSETQKSVIPVFKKPCSQANKENEPEKKGDATPKKPKKASTIGSEHSERMKTPKKTTKKATPAATPSTQPGKQVPTFTAKKKVKKAVIGNSQPDSTNQSSSLPSSAGDSAAAGAAASEPDAAASETAAGPGGPAAAAGAARPQSPPLVSAPRAASDSDGGGDDGGVTPQQAAGSGRPESPPRAASDSEGDEDDGGEDSGDDGGGVSLQPAAGDGDGDGSPWLRRPDSASLPAAAPGSPCPPGGGGGSSSVLEPAPTPSPRAYTELQSELTDCARSQELFESAGDADGYQSDPFEADD